MTLRNFRVEQQEERAAYNCTVLQAVCGPPLDKRDGGYH